MTTARRHNQHRQTGFTLIETLIVLAVIGILVLITAPAFLGMINRFKLTGTTREVASLMQAARMEAIKMNAPAQVNYDSVTNSFIAFVDSDRDGALTVPPDKILPASAIVPLKVYFQGPGDGTPNGPNAIDGWDDAPSPQLGPIFNPDGSVDSVGAYRLKDVNDNYLEVRIETTATGRILLRKRDKDDGIFYFNGESGHKWIWY